MRWSKPFSTRVWSVRITKRNSNLLSRFSCTFSELQGPSPSIVSRIWSSWSDNRTLSFNLGTIVKSYASYKHVRKTYFVACLSGYVGSTRCSNNGYYRSYCRSPRLVCVRLLGHIKNSMSVLLSIISFLMGSMERSIKRNKKWRRCQKISRDWQFWYRVLACSGLLPSRWKGDWKRFEFARCSDQACPV